MKIDSFVGRDSQAGFSQTDQINWESPYWDFNGGSALPKQWNREGMGLQWR